MPTNQIRILRQSGKRIGSLPGCFECRQWRDPHRDLEYKFGWKAGETPAASGDIVQLGRLDPGITVLANEMEILSEGIGGTTVTFTAIGDQQMANRYSDDRRCLDRCRLRDGDASRGDHDP